MILVIWSVNDVLLAHSRFVKFVGGEAAGQTPYTFYNPIMGPKYVSNRPYNKFITPAISVTDFWFWVYYGLTVCSHVTSTLWRDWLKLGGGVIKKQYLVFNNMQIY